MKPKKKVTEYTDDIDLVNELMSQAKPESLNFIDRATEITHQIHQIMSEKNITAKHLAELMEKSQPEISKFLSGSHNFTLRTLAHIESVLGQNIILTKVGIALEESIRYEEYRSRGMCIVHKKDMGIERLSKAIVSVDYNSQNDSYPFDYKPNPTGS